MLWAYWTTPRMTTGGSPFSLVYGADEFISVKIQLPNIIIKILKEDENEELMADSL